MGIIHLSAGSRSEQACALKVDKPVYNLSPQGLIFYALNEIKVCYIYIKCCYILDKNYI